MKGAPEKIIERCSTILINNEVVPMDSHWTSEFNRAYLELGGIGERVLGFCDYRLDENEFPR